jgi:hypothetical protein
MPEELNEDMPPVEAGVEEVLEEETTTDTGAVTE